MSSQSSQISRASSTTLELTALEGLVASECYASAVRLGEFLVAATRRGAPPLQRVGVLLATADALHGCGSWALAGGRYEEALDVLRRATPQQIPSSGGSSGGCRSEMEARASFRAAKCRYALHKKDPLNDGKHRRAALEHMERIGRSYESLPAVLFLAQMKVEDDCKSSTARDLYLRALDLNPLALEAVDALAKIDVARGDGVDLASEIVSRLNRAPEGSLAEATRDWVSIIARATQLRLRNQPKKALQLMAQVEERYFPECPQLLRMKAELHMDLFEPEDAIRHFEEMRRIDPLAIDGLDRYASLLYRRGQSVALNTLAGDLLRLDDARAETWNTAALYCELQQQTEKAFSFLEKSLALAPRHHFSLLLKGHLLLASVRQTLAVDNGETPPNCMRQLRDAENCFWKAYNLRPNFTALSGLTEALLQAKKLREAEQRAREGIRMRPQLWAAETLMGRVYLSQGRPQSRKKAAVCFERARRLDPRAEEPLMLLADLLHEEHKLDEAQEVGVRARWIANRAHTHAHTHTEAPLRSLLCHSIHSFFLSFCTFTAAPKVSDASRQPGADPHKVGDGHRQHANLCYVHGCGGILPDRAGACAALAGGAARAASA